ncbi:jg24398 [Pararge aegeria aegeria]|uniref:Jg24398 protein n=1 Tax=Pararge aegeria aegeria TaxID=348720 RepID=A0A8S4QX91_9NEOP|nr:jg24398 [Pararge aegeria aegeria]
MNLQNFPEGNEIQEEYEAEVEPLDQLGVEQLIETRPVGLMGAGPPVLLEAGPQVGAGPLTLHNAGPQALHDAGPLTDFLPRTQGIVDAGRQAQLEAVAQLEAGAQLDAGAQDETLAELQAQLERIDRQPQPEAIPQNQAEDGLQDEAAAVMEPTAEEIEMSEIQRLQVAAIIEELSDPFRFSEADEEPI